MVTLGLGRDSMASPREVAMALQLGALRNALVEAGASPAAADNAAEEVASHQNRLGSIEEKVTELKGSVAMVQWMLATNLAITAGVLWRLIAH
jgi:hypothetical protein